jgi:Succinylglutamate desuccinylase / Aspartoacylase family
MSPPLSLSPHIWRFADGTASNDLAAFDAQWAACMAALGWAPRVLGSVDGQPVQLWHADDRPGAAPDAAHPQLPRLLVAAGFHGEEPAGPWGVLRWLQAVLAVEGVAAAWPAAAISLLPLVNRTGFAAGTRFNRWGENPNRGYGQAAVAAQLLPSREGRMLLQHGALLHAASLGGALCCHEDSRASQAYVYSFEPATAPSARTRAVLAAGARHFGVMPDGTVDGCTVQGGVIFNHFDGSFESWMAEGGNRFAACVETPGQRDINTRTQAQADMVQAFVAASLKA